VSDSIFKVDKEKCDRDKLCALDCPRGIIQLDEEGYPFVAKEHEPVCIACGHCVAVCPHEAADVVGAPLSAAFPLDPALDIDGSEAVQFLRARRSIREYKPKVVERDLMERLIGVARYAPSASNSQLVHWTVIEGREKLERLTALCVEWMRAAVAADPKSPAAVQYFIPIVRAWEAGRDTVLRNAHTLVVASAPKLHNNGLVDSVIALTYLELAATKMGLGACWAGLLQMGMVNSKEIYAAVGLPEGHTHHYPMMVGYPKYGHQRLPERRAPRIVWK